MPRQLSKAPTTAIPVTSSLATACAWGYFALLILGFIVFHYGGSFAVVAGQEMSLPKAMFTTLNLGTLTGFQTTTNYTTDLKWQGQVLAILLMLGGILYSLIVGGTAAVRILRLPFTDRQVARFAMLITVAAVILGALLQIQGGQTLLASVFQSISAFGNAGGWMGIEPSLESWRTWIVLLPLATLGGLGLPVLIELVWGRRESTLSLHTRCTLTLTAGMVIGGTLLLFALSWPTKISGVDSLRLPFLLAVSGTLDARSAGLPFYFITPEFSRAASRVLLVLMLIGAGSAGTAGGLKLSTIYVLWRGTRESLASRPAGRSFGIALTWLAILMGVILLCHVNLLRQVPDLDTDRLFVLSVSAATNCGLAHDRVSLSQSGYNSLSITMLLGRIIPPMILWWMAQTTRDAEVCVG